MNKSILKAMMLGLLSSGVAVAALAGGPALDSNQVLVYYSDINLQSAAGQQVLKQRLKAAARRVCPDEFSRDRVFRTAGRSCVKNAVAQAMADVSERQLARAAAVNGNRG